MQAPRHTHRIVIESITENGRKFRPSDWIERLSANIAAFGWDQRLQYSRQLRPGMIDGEKCLILNSELEEANPLAYDLVLGFAKANGLRIRQEPA